MSQNIIVTTFDDNYFRSGLTLISSLRSSNPPDTLIIVYDLGLNPRQRHLISCLKNVVLRNYGNYKSAGFADALHPKARGYKAFAAAEVGRLCDAGSNVLWVDAGVAVTKDLFPVWKMIRENEAFFINHDDVDFKHLNGTFTHPKVSESLGATAGELLDEQVRSSFFGYKAQGSFQSLFDLASDFSRNRDAVSWPPQFVTEQPTHGGVPRISPDFKLVDELKRAVQKGKSINVQKLASATGYLGSRHDQSILGILASRFDAPVVSAREFCISTKSSSLRSFRNWLNDGVGSEMELGSTNVPLEAKESIAYQHRGDYVDMTILREVEVKLNSLVVMGNGPSLLKSVDLGSPGLDYIGMNSALRFWKKTAWYPDFYACLDNVLGESLKEEIADLIREREANGVQKFFLRDNLLRVLPDEIANLECVISFDSLARKHPFLSHEPITTGSHSALLGILLGYRVITLAGVNLNYIEQVPGSVVTDDGVMEIRKSLPNPNYFFDGYQQPGDRYNIPNPTPGLHQRAWAGVTRISAELGIDVYHLDQESAGLQFPKLNFFETRDVLTAQALEAGAGSIFGSSYRRKWSKSDSLFQFHCESIARVASSLPEKPISALAEPNNETIARFTDDSRVRVKSFSHRPRPYLNRLVPKNKPKGWYLMGKFDTYHLLATSRFGRACQRWKSRFTDERSTDRGQGLNTLPLFIIGSNSFATDAMTILSKYHRKIDGLFVSDVFSRDRAAGWDPNPLAEKLTELSYFVFFESCEAGRGGDVSTEPRLIQYSRAATPLPRGSTGMMLAFRLEQSLGDLGRVLSD